MAILFAGAVWSDIPDWDIGVSVLMGLLAYATAAPSMRVLLERRWRLIPHALFWTWFTVDGIYVVYWATRDLEALFMRPANFWASFGLYGMCGLVWYSRDTLKNTLLAWKKTPS